MGAVAIAPRLRPLSDVLEDASPPVPWLVRGLGIAPGAPAAIVGKNGTGKSMLAQSLALHVATGRRLWGRYDVRQGRVAHYDYEQGIALTARRYQRLATAMGLEKDEYVDRICVDSRSVFRITDDDAAARLASDLQGFDLAIFDALRGMIRGIDENDARMRDRIDDVLQYASEQTNCAIVFLHHSGKDGRSTRGSSAIDDAVSTHLHVTRIGRDRRLEYGGEHKIRDGASSGEVVGLRYESDQSDDYSPINVVVSTPAGERVEADSGDSRDALKDRIVGYVRGKGSATREEIQNAIKGRAATRGDALKELVDENVLLRTENTPYVYRLAG